MYDRLLKLLSEAGETGKTGETEEHREVKRRVAAKRKQTMQNFLFGKEPNPRGQGEHPGDDVPQGKNKGRQGP